MAIDISVRSNVKQISKKLGDFAYRQMPFATAQALTALAKEVKADEESNIAHVFNHPRPFTRNAVGVQAARKDNLTATVYMRPIAAKYLEPYESGGVHKLPGRALLNPKNIRLDQYGQLSRTVLARLKGRQDVFIGPVKTANGMVDGVWQRLKPTRGKPASLKLLIRFGDALPVPKHLNYRARAQALVSRRFNSVFGAALARAMATAK